MQAATSASLPKIKVPKTAKKRRRRNSRRYRLPTAALRQLLLSARWISLSLLIVCGGALLLVGREAAFYLNEVPVEGTVSISGRQIAAASGLVGAHVFAADPNDAADRIAQLPGIISATVTLEWPNQVSIKVGEDSPLAVWEQAGEQFWVGEGGRLIPSRGLKAELLHIESELSVPVGEVKIVPEEVVSGALQLRELRPNIEKLFYRPGTGLSYQDGRGWRAHFGTGLDMAQKLSVYETAVEDLLARGITPAYVSVANRSKPYYMPFNN